MDLYYTLDINASGLSFYPLFLSPSLSAFHFVMASCAWSFILRLPMRWISSSQSASACLLSSPSSWRFLGWAFMCWRMNVCIFFAVVLVVWLTKISAPKEQTFATSYLIISPNCTFDGDIFTYPCSHNICTWRTAFCHQLSDYFSQLYLWWSHLCDWENLLHQTSSSSQIKESHISLIIFEFHFYW